MIKNIEKLNIGDVYISEGYIGLIYVKRITYINTSQRIIDATYYTFSSESNRILYRLREGLVGFGGPFDVITNCSKESFDKVAKEIIKDYLDSKIFL